MIGQTNRQTEITTSHTHNELGFVWKKSGLAVCLQSIYLGYVATIIYFTLINTIIIMKKEARVKKNTE